MRTGAELITSDREKLWHPYANPYRHDPLYAVIEAEGCRLVLDDGTHRHEVVDGMASWWSAIHGYRHPVLDAAVTEQTARFAHVMFGGLTHAPAVELAERLLELAPGMARVFPVDSGSVAMEVALKIVRQAGIAGARPRTRFAALHGGYHGDTWGAMSVCDPDGGMHALYAGQVQSHVFLPRPPAFDADEAELAAWDDKASALIRQHRDELAGIVLEPVLQGAGGMWAWAPAALRRLRELADEYDLLLVADEIATGFGRTGRLWGCDWAGIRPDVLAVGKALTGGYLTQAAVLTTERVARALTDGPAGVLMHGPTFMANPLASAVSNASLGLIAAGGWQRDVPRIEAVLTAELDDLRTHPGVADVRVLGATAAVELRSAADLRIATEAAVAHGVWLRPFGKLIYAMPPYVATDDEVRTIAGGIRAAVTAAVRGSEQAAGQHG
ncbi:adenosylmethionine--8-amino-7-oxononanoate transaminase [Enemella sp. A6]|uniref:adenosylmethionine--8-amino-7-oxononanoate transaminase n=1 Tax=Enemella sp. A6 TaxID=3440152 RepID=UPI003EC14D67